MNTSTSKKRIVILGGGFGGVATPHHLERLVRRRPDVEIVLVSRDNFLLMTPLLFEVFSGALASATTVGSGGWLSRTSARGRSRTRSQKAAATTNPQTPKTKNTARQFPSLLAESGLQATRATASDVVR